MTSRQPSWPDHRACSIEVLIVPGCPGAPLALARVQEATEALGVDANLRVLTVEDKESARDLAFVGSPTVRVDGRDVEDVDGRPFGLACRIYESEEGVERAPPSSWIRRAIVAWRRPS
jgi:hypothetical protein